MQKNIFIYEPYGTGHHVGFLQILLTEFARHHDWHATLLTTEEARDHPAFPPLVQEFENSLDIVVAPSVRIPSLIRAVAGNFYAEQYANFGSLRRKFEALQAVRRFDFALLPYMESVGIHNLARRSVFKEVPWGAIAFGLRFHFKESGIRAPSRRTDTLQRLCFRHVLKTPSLAAIFTLDPYLARWASDHRVIHVPDPSHLPPPLDKRECRRSLKLPERAPIVLVYGAIDRRKCLDLLLPAVASIDLDLNVTLVVAGIQDRRLQRGTLGGEAAMRLRRESRLIEIDRFISPEEERLLFSSADIVWTYYADAFGSSGVLIKAGQHGKPTIANDAGLVGKIVSDERCGLAIAKPDPALVAVAIVELATEPDAAKKMGDRGFARFSGNTPEAFGRPIGAAIEAAGLART